MQTLMVTTPVGRRSMTLGQLQRQLQTAKTQTGKTADKWRLFRDVCEARAAFKLQDRALAVLNALLSFHRPVELSEAGGLVVFPSNAQLSIRANGMAAATLRRHLAALVEAGLIQRKDSANGKRYAHKGASGEIEEAFGFSLAPLLARRDELAQLAQAAAAARIRFSRTKEALTICRRDARKLISAALAEGADGDWGAVEAEYVDMVARIPRGADLADLEAVLRRMEEFRATIIKRLESYDKSQNMSTSAAQTERHIQNSNTQIFRDSEFHNEHDQGEFADGLTDAAESEDGESQPEAVNSPLTRGQPTATGEGMSAQAANKHHSPRRPAQTLAPKRAFSLGMVLKACPDIAAYGPNGAVASWRDLMAAAVVVRSMLGVSPSAYEAACEAMGPENAAVTIACILARHGHINSAGGYLRGLTARARQGQFSPAPALIAQIRANGGENVRSA